ncbi:hypothetical protein QQX98_004354 [Neonectria punicea]|uniref:Major facilitator superfamily (MFS) profile domain-containing protein n=1 Tax=Neonectria punicea TaxID=979145 RepID=A0ABR1H9A5_9HYPO
MEEVLQPMSEWSSVTTPNPSDGTSTNNTVQFDGPNDEGNPKNWPVRQKVTCTVLYGLLTMGITFSSAVYSAGVKHIAKEFGSSQDIANLGTSTLLIGLGTGPLLWAPMSEMFGRKIPVLVPYLLALIFTVGTAVATNIVTIPTTRFFVGFFGSAPMVITGGVLGDLFDPQQRGLALVGYAGAIVGGPVFVYSIVYLNLGAFPIIFQQERGWNELQGSLPFLALLIGIIAGAFMNIHGQTFYLKRVASNNGRAVPEARLPPMMAGAISITLGLFIFGNTGEANFHWVAPVSGAALMGFGFFTIFQAALNYVVDTFPRYGASAMAANTFLRSSMASIFPPIVSCIYDRLGIVWASNMLAFIAFLMVPIPWLFYYRGKSFRALGKLSQDSV